MNIDILKKLWNKHEDEEFLNFARVKNKRSKRADIHAFLLLDELIPGTDDIISAAEHDEFFLSVDTSELAAVITEAQIVELVRCGVRLTEYDCLGMFV